MDPEGSERHILHSGSEMGLLSLARGLLSRAHMRRTRTPIADLNALLSASNVCFLYHTFEKQSWTPQAANRNILSFPDGNPEVVHPDCEFGKFPGYGVSSKELGLMEYARFHFEETPNDRVLSKTEPE